ncbi:MULTISPECIES: hypothetical protein [Xanthomonas]|uniref:DUF4345 domain-containing protein n=1 Tax=Xanthomonas protegens TaxID=3380705 RepID=A0ABU9LAY2_9XANT|nr:MULTISPECIES: hypothetical protein [Xanthomonas]AJC45406.1 membrane protein [Xanthomonas sacchari]KAA8919706.1 DUF4345 domain-containing protein [Xanthomonas sontii]MCW0450449.1 hypothetical protein [Xanthomonas sacchari]
MAKAYLWFNAALYALLAVWCTLLPAQTAAAVGYVGLDRSGQSEYLVIYGGLQLGMAFLFGYFARTGQLRTGLLLALAFYVPIVLYRSASLLRLWPVGPTTTGLAAFEIVLLLTALVLWRRQRA